MGDLDETAVAIGRVQSSIDLLLKGHRELYARTNEQQTMIVKITEGNKAADQKMEDLSKKIDEMKIILQNHEVIRQQVSGINIMIKSRAFWVIISAIATGTCAKYIGNILGN